MCASRYREEPIWAALKNITGPLQTYKEAYLRTPWSAVA